MTSILRHVAEAFPPARQGTILNSHRVIGNATNTSMVIDCVLVTYIMMTADVGLPDAVLLPEASGHPFVLAGHGGKGIGDHRWKPRRCECVGGKTSIFFKTGQKKKIETNRMVA